MPQLISILVLGVLVLVHEWGHFAVARRCGVLVERFSIGFGPVLARWKRGETEYCWAALPLGGYVKMAGEQAGEAAAKNPRAFSSQPTWVRAAIIAAGPAVNYVTSVVALWAVLVLGYPELSPVVGRVLEETPAKAAGLTAKDQILSVDGTATRTWDEMTAMVHASAGREVTFRIQREGRQLTVPMTPKAKEIVDPFGRHKTVGLVGIGPSGDFTTYRVGPLEAVRTTFSKQAEWLSQIGLSLWSLVIGRMPIQESLTGPIGIVILTSEAVKMGFSPLLYLVSLFSLSLALFNIFPIPILDGGHLLFLGIEKLRGIPVSQKVQERMSQVSFAMLVTLLVFVCFNDLQRFGLVDKVVGWFRG